MIAAAGLLLAMIVGQSAYVGRPLADVLRDLQASGLKVVFSSELVRSDLRVTVEPRARSPKRMLDEMLKPHGLETRDGPNGTILIVARARNPAARKPAPAAPSVGTIRGRVVNATTGAPVADALVEVQETGQSAHTDAQGGFVLTGVPEGRQALFVSMIGYALARPTVDVTGGATSEATVPLAEGTGAYTERVTVTAERRIDPANTAPSLETLNSAGLQSVRAVLVDDPLRAVQALPAVAANDDFRSDFSVRGSDFNHLGMSIDGVATPWLLHDFQGTEDSGSMALLNSDILDRVTLSLGSYPQRYSDRTGAWLDATMREGSRAKREVRGAVSGTNASLLAEGPVGGGSDGSWLVSFRRSYIDWLIRRIVPDFSDSVFGFTDLQSKVVYDLSPRQQLQVMGIVGWSRLDDTNTDANSPAHAADDLALGTVALRSTLAPSLVLTQRASGVFERFRNNNKFDAENGAGNFRDLSYRADVAWTPDAATLVEAGAQLQHQNTSRTLSQYTYAADRVTPVLRRSDAFAGAADVSSAFAHVVLGSDRRFSIMPGARVAHSTANDETVVSPWLQMRLALPHELSLRAGAGVYHQFPDFSQVLGPHAGTDLQAERARQVDVSLEHQITPTTRWQVSLYHRNDDRVLRLAAGEFRVVNGRPMLPSDDDPWKNSLEGQSNGVEFLVQRASDRGLSGWASYSLGHTWYRDVLTREEFDGDFDQRHTLNLWGQYAISSRSSISAKLRVGSNFPLRGYWEERPTGLFMSDERNQVRVPLYSRLDVRANRVFNYTRRRLTLFVEVMNVLDHENVRGVSPSSITFATRRATGYLQGLFPRMPSAGVLIEF